MTGNLFKQKGADLLFENKSAPLFNERRQFMNATLSLHDSSMTAEDIAELTGRLRHDIEQETELTARQVETAGGLGAKGDFVSIGQIALVALGSSGTVVTLLRKRSQGTAQTQLKSGICPLK
jgi:hypothetical protein